MGNRKAGFHDLIVKLKLGGWILISVSRDDVI
jgi:hypothetical protein